MIDMLRPDDMRPALVGRKITAAEYTQDGGVRLTLDDGSTYSFDEYMLGGVVVCKEARND